MIIHELLQRLDGVKDCGGGKYRARCPAHQGKSQSLAIRACDDGRLLLHCFAGCDVESVCDAVGMKLRDLMPPKAVSHHVRGEPWNPRDVLESVAHEIFVATMVTEAIALSGEASQDDLDTMTRCAGRLSHALNLIRYRRPPELRAIRSGRAA